MHPEIVISKQISFCLSNFQSKKKQGMPSSLPRQCPSRHCGSNRKRRMSNVSRSSSTPSHCPRRSNATFSLSPATQRDVSSTSISTEISGCSLVACKFYRFNIIYQMKQRVTKNTLKLNRNESCILNSPQSTKCALLEWSAFKYCAFLAKATSQTLPLL